MDSSLFECPPNVGGSASRPSEQPQFMVSPVSFSGPSAQDVLALGIVLIGTVLAIDLLCEEPVVRRCGVCGHEGHDRRTCPHGGPRRHFSRAVPKNTRCECCGQPGYAIERHHARGRSSVADYLDVCRDCHLECCHRGDFRNLPIKPRVCRVLERSSAWQT